MVPEGYMAANVTLNFFFKYVASSHWLGIIPLKEGLKKYGKLE
jgi:hypothetical protein